MNEGGWHGVEITRDDPLPGPWATYVPDAEWRAVTICTAHREGYELNALQLWLDEHCAGRPNRVCRQDCPLREEERP